jgi:hypothetical protein
VPAPWTLGNWNGNSITILNILYTRAEQYMYPNRAHTAVPILNLVHVTHRSPNIRALKNGFETLLP